MIDVGQVTFSTASRPGKPRNEDFVAATGDIAMLLDGASVPAEMPSCCGCDAAWYVRSLAAVLTGYLAEDPAVSLTAKLAVRSSESAASTGRTDREP